MMLNTKEFFVFILSFVTALITAQTTPSNRVYDWEHAGLIEPLPAYTTTLNMQTSGADVTGILPSDDVYLSVISQCTVTNQSYTIFFPMGVYTFTNTIHLKDNVKLEGVGADTRLIFTNNGTCVNLQGVTNTTTTYSITQTGNRYDRFLKSSANGSSITMINANDFIVLKQRAAYLVNNSWAYNSVGQFFKITAIADDTLKLNHELRKNYALNDTISLYKVSPIKNAGLKCLRITRRNANITQSATIQFTSAYNCFAEGIEMDSCFFSHITLEQSANCQVSGSYFHDAYDYGGGGRAYGITVQFNSSDHKIENNIFDHLRHAVLFQAGANGNVVDYNYSINPFWTGVSLPANSAGDIVLHGNYVYANLFEGNSCQNIVIDNSHGQNGPHNTFFRNRAKLYGIFMNNNPASNDQNMVGNEITGTGLFQGQYSLAGTGHFEYGNNKQGTVTPAGTSNLTDLSYCFTTLPGFLAGYAWPVIGTPNAYNTGTIPADVRNASSSKISCNAFVTGIEEPLNSANQFQIYPNPANRIVTINTLVEFDEVTISDLLGKILIISAFSKTIDISNLSNGVYSFTIKSHQKVIYAQKIVITK